MRTHLTLIAIIFSLICSVPCQASDAEQQNPGVLQKVEHAVEHGAKVTVRGVKRGAKATAHGARVAARATTRGVKAAARGIAKGASSAAQSVESAASKVKDKLTPEEPSPNP